MNLVGVVLAGGNSARMGTDKALLRIHNITLLERTARVLQPLTSALAIAGRAQPNNWPADLSATFLPDPSPTALGPIIGVATALRHFNTPILVLSCDLPGITAAVLSPLIAAWKTAKSPGIVTTHIIAGQTTLEPLIAIYTPALLPAIDARIQKSQRSLWRLCTEENLPQWPCPPLYSPQLDNLNDPQSVKNFFNSLNCTEK